jgi:hypothetical protein
MPKDALPSGSKQKTPKNATGTLSQTPKTIAAISKMKSPFVKQPLAKSSPIVKKEDAAPFESVFAANDVKHEEETAIVSGVIAPVKFLNAMTNDEARSCTPVPVETAAPSAESLLFSPRKTPKSDRKMTPKKVKTPDMLSPRKSQRSSAIKSVAEEQTVADNQSPFTIVPKSPKTALMLSNIESFASSAKRSIDSQAEESQNVTVKAGTPKKVKSNPVTPIKKMASGLKPIPATEMAAKKDTRPSGHSRLSFLSARPVLSSIEDDITDLAAEPLGESPEENLQEAPVTPKKKCVCNEDVVMSAKKSVKFGPALSPEIFDSSKPTSTPVKRGTPIKAAVQNEATMLRSLLKKQTEHSEVAEVTPFADALAAVDSSVICAENDEHDESVIGAAQAMDVDAVEQNTDEEVQVQIPSEPHVEKSKTMVGEQIDLTGVAKMLRTPRPGPNNSLDGAKLVGVREMLKTPKPVAGKVEIAGVTGLKHMFKTPIAEEPVNLVGVKTMLKTPVAADVQGLEDVAGLLKTPAACSHEPVTSSAAHSTKPPPSIIQTPKPASEVDFTGIAFMMATPAAIVHRQECPPTSSSLAVEPQSTMDDTLVNDTLALVVGEETDQMDAEMEDATVTTELVEDVADENPAEQTDLDNTGATVPTVEPVDALVVEVEKTKPKRSRKPKAEVAVPLPRRTRRAGMVHVEENVAEEAQSAPPAEEEKVRQPRRTRKAAMDEIQDKKPETRAAGRRAKVNEDVGTKRPRRQAIKNDEETAVEPETNEDPVVKTRATRGGRSKKVTIEEQTSVEETTAAVSKKRATRAKKTQDENQDPSPKVKASTKKTVSDKVVPEITTKRVTRAKVQPKRKAEEVASPVKPLRSLRKRH